MWSGPRVNQSPLQFRTFLGHFALWEPILDLLVESRDPDNREIEPCKIGPKGLSNRVQRSSLGGEPGWAMFFFGLLQKTWVLKLADGRCIAGKKEGSLKAAAKGTGALFIPNNLSLALNSASVLYSFWGR